MTNGRQVLLFFLAVGAFLTVTVAAFAGLNELSQHYGWDGCKTVHFGNHTARVCER